MTNHQARPAMRTWEVLVLLALAAGLVWLLLNATKNPYPSHRISDSNSLRQVAIALLAYNRQHGTFPEVLAREDQDAPLRSWRVALLPYLEMEALYERYQNDVLWDAPEHREMLDARIPAYLSPLRQRAGPDVADPTRTFTDYVVITGPGSIFPPGRQPLSMDEITDGPNRTVICMQLPDSDIHWMEPRDVTIDQVLEKFADPDGAIAEQGFVNMAFADGSVQMVPADIDPEELRAMLTADGGEAFPYPDQNRDR